MDRRCKLSEEKKKKLVDLYISGMSTVKIGKMFNMRASSVTGYIKRAGVERRSNKINSRKYDVNHDFFENIDSEEKAYWLGFMYADGYVTKRGQVGISLAIIDKNHLNKFNSIIDSNYEIKTYTQNVGYAVGTEYAKLIIQSNKMKSDLEKHGCVEHKTNIITEPKISNDLIRHFIRGYLDGDGCITNHKNKYGSYDWVIKILGTEKLLNFIKDFVHTNNIANINKYYKRRKDHIVQTLEFGGNNQVEKFLDIIYKNANIYLDRKYDKYINFKKYLFIKHCRAYQE